MQTAVTDFQAWIQSPLQIGGVTLRNRIACAPMAGLTDVPYRSVAWQMGAGYLVSEMVGSKPQLWDTGKSQQRRVPVPGVHPNAIQIAGFDPATMADAARAHVDEGAEVVDLNFGCPAKKVLRKAAGSALLADPGLIGQIVEAVVAAVPVPVTVKTRLGLTVEDTAGLEAARCAQEAGAAMLTMHARTRACRFVGPVNYAAVAQIKQALDIPVLINGDISSQAEIEHAIAASGADGVMIGRAGIGQPWLFRKLLVGESISPDDQWSLLLEQLQHMHEFYGERQGTRIARKHVQAFLKHQGLGQHIGGFMKLERASQQTGYLTQLKQQSRQAA
ncbi:MAG: tRNA dihydrouridine synthase DusB [Pseudomonadota bacterium]